MKDIEYIPKSYRLNKMTTENLKNIKEELKISYNLLFTCFIKNYKKGNIELIFKDK